MKTGIGVGMMLALLMGSASAGAQSVALGSGVARAEEDGPRAEAPAAWIQEDPGAQAYKAAREALNARRWQEAARRFEALRSEHPKSGYVPDSYYYQAFALSREGTRASLGQAIELLKIQQQDYPKAATGQDAAELRVRVEGQLARQGDASSAAAIAQQASQPCQGDQEVRLAALGALLNMNAERAVPILQEVLKNRDECSVELRRRAVFLLAQKMNDSSVAILLDLAQRNPDPDPEVRKQAVFWLSQVETPAALAALESILKDGKDPELQQTALFAISQHGDEAAVKVLRSYAERTDAPKELREKAIFWIGQSQEAGGPRYLMDLYGRLQDPDLKERTIMAVAQGGGDEARSWLLARATDRSESVDVRKNALFWAGQTGALGADELGKLYRSLDAPELKKQVIFVASQEDEKGAVDFLMDVARTEKDKDLRQNAIFWLGQSKDPRVADFLLGLIRK
jgi:HEAT repeat protein